MLPGVACNSIRDAWHNCTWYGGLHVYTRTYAYCTLASVRDVVADRCTCISPLLIRLGTACEAHHMQHTQYSAVYVLAWPGSATFKYANKKENAFLFA